MTKGWEDDNIFYYDTRLNRLTGELTRTIQPTKKYLKSQLKIENGTRMGYKLSKVYQCKVVDKLHAIKEYDGTIVDRWFDENDLKKGGGQVPVIIETNKGSDEIWINGTGKIAIYHDDNGLGYLNIRQEKIDLITLHFISVNYKDFQFITESSMIIKDDDSAKYYNFQNKPEISSKGYGICEKLKWEVK
jgi:hypothetical protein